MIVKEVDYQQYQVEIQRIRTEVFVIEQSVPEDIEYDDRDVLCHHVLAFDGDIAVATGRIDTDQGGKIGRVSVLDGERSHGIGEQVMQALHRIARRAGLNSVRLNAQVSALPFYQALGYQAEGAVFMEAGIPHQAMARAIE
ncbi:MAG: GNAT family N-acetyltransferase [Halopseudomonas sp.]